MIGLLILINKLDLQLIPYWVDQSNFNSSNTFGEDISIGFLGRLNKNKGIEELLLAFNKLDTTNLTLTIGGYGEPSYLEILTFNLK